MKRLCLILLSIGLLVGPALAEDSYYKRPPQFHFFPDPEAPRWTIGRLGPIGLAIELRQPAFTMYIKSVEPDSPAASTGRLTPGQIIESINGQVLKDEDPRVILGNLITRIEATDGKVRMMVKDKPDARAEPVEFSIPVMGPYSDTWPVNCTKSDRIVREMADWLRKSQQWGWGAALFMLSTGDEEDLAEVRRRFSGKLSTEQVGHTWSIGYTGIAICEYYLRTGDTSVLGAIKARADHLRDTMYNGSWMGRGGANFNYMAGGHLNAAGLHANTFLLLAKECGVDVDQRTLIEGMTHIFRFAGRGNVAYGDHKPETGMTDNGKVGKLAFAMNAAANLVGRPESSVYAKARDISATKSFYSTSWLFHGHTGGGIGELWRGAAMGLVKDKRPAQYRSFMDERRWMYEMARTHDGMFGWADGVNVSYNRINDGSRPNGNYIGLMYTMHRKRLRIFGAPPTRFSKTYELPERPWGNEADDVFYSLQPGEYAPGKRLDISKEMLRTHASAPLGRTLGRPDVTDEELLAYAYHIDHGIRAYAVGRMAATGRIDMIVDLLKSDDPRARRAALGGITGQGKNRAMPAEARTEEMFKLAAAMVNDPDESWWVVEAALRVLGMAPPEMIGPHMDRIAYWMEHEEWWLRAAAMEAATPLVGDERYYQRVLSIVGEKIATNGRAAALAPVPRLLKQVQQASPKVQAYAAQTIGKAYKAFPQTIDTPGNRDMEQGVDYLLTAMARYMADVPGGFDVLYEVARQRFPNEPLPHLDVYMAADPDEFGPVVKQVFEPLMRDKLIWQYVADNLVRLDRELSARMPDRATAGLVDLYQKVGDHQYDWNLWGPARDKIAWHYTTYDPPEKKLWERNVWRYRPVTWPRGAEDWMQPEFDPMAAGWKIGFAPFGHNDGKLAPIGGCVGADHFCGCGNMPNTFWENEVLLMRTTLDLPAMQDGYAYRFQVGGRSHVGGGDGSDVWINGTRKQARRKTEPTLSGVGKRVGGQPWAFVIDDTFRKQFDGDPVTIAATGFNKLHRSGVKLSHQAFWFERMKLPALGRKEILRALRATPLRTAAWQDSGSGKDMFHFDGSFQPNEEAMGKWQQVGVLPTGQAFDPNANLRREGRWYGQFTLTDDGRTDDRMLYYCGDMLLDLPRKQALKMQVKTIDQTEYLFVETGDFEQGKMIEEDTPSYYVLKRAE